MNSEIQKLLNDLIFQLSFKTMLRKEKDKLISRIKGLIDNYGGTMICN